MKRILFVLSLCSAHMMRSEQDALSSAIRESNVEQVEQLVESVPVSHLAYYCSLADQIITLRRELRMNAEFLYSVDKIPASDFKEPNGYRYAGLFSFGVAGYGFYQICNDHPHGLTTMFAGLIAFIGISIHVNGMRLKYIRQTYENALIVKEILVKKLILWNAQSIAA